ncbi:MAG: terpene cyclase/mutase family protein [Proteobacteria bacterium]|nr:terpene cyclase/mutase family protein [Pseudomonadota bacterium]MBU4259777.1 terpene cyclase/mutase family protein [Pseudomonadota bacterium]MBU4287542.1 terpene cyclase/mutase family protein [Pseudomonadota bacterium]MBU4414585.1 terpene cyclase/mutase family protein [Pseudomonadota bacterium]MCG2759149.1 terpene cyclase/mutase family protein [Desulfobacteraceae bacterium]
MSYENLLSNKTVPSLTKQLESGLDKNLDALRIARIGTCLLLTGGHRNNPVIAKSANSILGVQQKDGGWIDAEETIWCLAFLKCLGCRQQEDYKKGLRWLHSQRYSDGGWGKTNRDISRIPVTGLLLYLLPELSDQKAINWLKKEWRKDFQSNTKLTYKGAFFLLGLSASRVAIDECPLIEETYSFLHAEQNDDGGFGPWKDHPIGSDPWSTGIVLLGLLSYRELVKKAVIEKTVNWLAENQLSNGLWPYHYIEEGSAYAYWGLVEALKYLSKESD